MAIQTKTLLGDVGSAVQQEVASQLNRACSYANFFFGTFTEGAGGPLFPTPAENRINITNPVAAGMSTQVGVGTMFSATWAIPEDVVIVDISAGFVGPYAGPGFQDANDMLMVTIDGIDPLSGGDTIWQAIDFSAGSGIAGAVINDTWVSFATLQEGADPTVSGGTFPLVVRGADFTNDGPQNMVTVMVLAVPGEAIPLLGISIAYRPLKDVVNVKNVVSGAGKTFRSVPR